MRGLNINQRFVRSHRGKSIAQIVMLHLGNQPKLAIWHLLSESAKEVFMTNAPRITVEDLKKRMDAGEDFTIVDVRNPTAWAESDTAIPEAIRVPLEELEQNLSRIPKNRPVVAYCT